MPGIFCRLAGMAGNFCRVTRQKAAGRGVSSPGFAAYRNSDSSDWDDVFAIESA